MADMMTADTPKTGVNLLKTMRDIPLQAIKAGLAEKERIYSPGARECLRLYFGDHKYITNPTGVTQEQYSLFTRIEGMANARRPRPTIFNINDPVAARCVQTYLPFLTGDELIRTVEAARPLTPPPEAYGLVPQAITEQQYLSGNMAFVVDQQQKNQQYQMVLMQIEMEYNQRKFRASQQQEMLNYSAKELALKGEMEMALIESLVVGGGVMLTGSVDMPGGAGRLVGSQWISMDDVVFDPDVTRLKDAKWAAIRFRFPKWLVSQMTGIPEQHIQGSASSQISQEQYRNLLITAGYETQAQRKMPQDEVVIWKFWSRMGIGARLQPAETRDPDYAALDGKLGDWTYLLISECCEYPLNVTPQTLEQMLQLAQMSQQMQAQGMPPQYDPVDIIRAATKWPVSYWMEADDPWPFTMIAYHHRTGSPYPVPMLEFALSYIKFMVWVLCFIADKSYRANRDLILCDETTNEDLIHALENMEDEPIVKIKGLNEKNVTDLIQYLKTPELHKDIIDIYFFFQEKFEEMTGLTQLKRGKTQRQMRSATEAEVLASGDRIQPNKMADDVDDAHVRIARKEAIAAQEILKGKDVEFIFGAPGAAAWDQAVASTNLVKITRESTFKVETGRGKRLDIKTRRENMDKMMQTVAPLLVSFAQETGFTDAINGFLSEYAKVNQVDPELVKLPSTQQLQAIMQQRMMQEQQAAAQSQMMVQQHAAQVAPKKEGAN